MSRSVFQPVGKRSLLAWQRMECSVHPVLLALFAAASILLLKFFPLNIRYVLANVPVEVVLGGSCNGGGGWMCGWVGGCVPEGPLRHDTNVLLNLQDKSASQTLQLFD